MRKLGKEQCCIERMEEEYGRKGGWEPVIPNRDDPFKYEFLFESKKQKNISLWNYLKNQNKKNVISRHN